MRVLSPGDDGDVSQENNSYADATAKNDNDTDQTIDQTQRSHGCGCKASDLIQAAGQSAFNWQDADAGLSQSNNSWADAFAKNENELDPDIDQSQG